MCDYSLEMYASRPAVEGERLTTSRFESGSIGLAAAGGSNATGDKPVAVCLACDMRLLLEKIPVSVQQEFDVGQAVEATFVRIEHGSYHDGVQFDNGKSVSLQVLGAGVDISMIAIDAHAGHAASVVAPRQLEHVR